MVCRQGQRKSRLMVEKAEKLVLYTGKLVKLQIKLEFQKLMAVAINILTAVFFRYSNR